MNCSSHRYCTGGWNWANSYDGYTIDTSDYNSLLEFEMTGSTKKTCTGSNTNLTLNPDGSYNISQIESIRYDVTSCDGTAIEDGGSYTYGSGIIVLY